MSRKRTSHIARAVCAAALGLLSFGGALGAQDCESFVSSIGRVIYVCSMTGGGIIFSPSLPVQGGTAGGNVSKPPETPGNPTGRTGKPGGAKQKESSTPGTTSGEGMIGVAETRGLLDGNPASTANRMDSLGQIGGFDSERNQIHFPNMIKTGVAEAKSWAGDPADGLKFSPCSLETMLMNDAAEGNEPEAPNQDRLSSSLMAKPPPARRSIWEHIEDVERTTTQRFSGSSKILGFTVHSSHQLAAAEDNAAGQIAVKVVKNTRAIESNAADCIKRKAGERKGVIEQLTEPGGDGKVLSGDSLRATLATLAKAEGFQSRDALLRMGIVGDLAPQVTEARRAVPTDKQQLSVFGQLLSVEERLRSTRTSSPQGARARSAAESALIQGYDSVRVGDTGSASACAVIAAALLEVVVSVYPPTGFARDVYELVTGENALTGERLTDAERGLAVLGVATVGLLSSVTKLHKVIKAILLAEEGTRAAKAFDRVAVTAEAVSKRFGSSPERTVLIARMVKPDGGLSVSPGVARQLRSGRVLGADPTLGGRDRSFVPIQSILETIGSGSRVSDPRNAAGRFLYAAEAGRYIRTETGFRYSNRTLEVLVNESQGVVEHVLYK